MPETFDLQRHFDELVSDVSRAAGPGDARVPQRRARRRRALAGAVAALVVATVGVTTVQLVGDDAPDSAPDIADRRSEPSPGLERRERLLGVVPADSRQVNVLDVEGLTGKVGLDPADPGDQQLLRYVLSGFVQLGEGPLPAVLLPDLTAYAGTGATDVFLLDRTADEVTDRLLRAGWEDDGDGVLTPGPGVRRFTASLARQVRVVDEQGRALVVVAARARLLPGPGAPGHEPGPVASRLLDLGGAAGVSIDFSGPCALQGFTLASPTEGSVLVDPPSGVAAEDVAVGDLTAPEGVTSVDAVSASGSVVRAEVTVPDPAGPMQVVSRLGLPGTEFC